jgi:hypothetical protein
LSEIVETVDRPVYLVVAPQYLVNKTVLVKGPDSKTIQEENGRLVRCSARLDRLVGGILVVCNRHAGFFIGNGMAPKPPDAGLDHVGSAKHKCATSPQERHEARKAHSFEISRRTRTLTVSGKSSTGVKVLLAAAMVRRRRKEK